MTHGLLDCPSPETLPNNCFDTDVLFARFERDAPDWAKASGKHYFKQGGVDDLLDDGVARCYTALGILSQVGEFLRLCAGAGAGRPVDLVLFGHVHRNVEYRLANVNGHRMCFQDFYTENPNETRYYSSIKMTDSLDGPPVATARAVQIDVSQSQTTGNVDTSQVPEVLRVPPYATPLENEVGEGAARTWWTRHRPLLIQTASLGPIDFAQRSPQNPNPAFQGFRIVSLKNDAIERVHYVTLSDLRANNFVMPFEEELRPPGGGLIEAVLHIMMQ